MAKRVSENQTSLPFPHPNAPGKLSNTLMRLIAQAGDSGCTSIELTRLSGYSRATVERRTRVLRKNGYIQKTKASRRGAIRYAVSNSPPPLPPEWDQEVRGKLSNILLPLVTEAGGRGCTNRELSDRTGFPVEAVAQCVNRLFKLGHIRNTGRKRSSASVWVKALDVVRPQPSSRWLSSIGPAEKIVLRAITEARFGCTTDEIIRATGLTYSVVTKRRISLLRKGYVREIGRRRPAHKSGFPAVVWGLAPERAVPPAAPPVAPAAPVRDPALPTVEEIRLTVLTMKHARQILRERGEHFPPEAAAVLLWLSEQS